MIWVSGLFAFLSLWTVCKAPARLFWWVAIGVTEWGHWMAILSVGLALISWTTGRRWGIPSWLFVAAAILYSTPLVRALAVARDVPWQLGSRFGPFSPREEAHAPARPQPLKFTDLFKGVYSPSVQMRSLVYAEKEGQRLSLDLYQPSVSMHSLPGLLVVHGGSWQTGERTELQALSRYLAARGYLVASIDYRLAPKAVFPAPEEDVFSALAYLKSHARELGMDKDQVVLLGRSAGGQIALSAAYAEKDPAIKGVIVFYAPNDLVWGYSIPGNPLIMDSQKIIETYLGGRPENVPGVYEAASPLHFVGPKTPPTLMIHGDRDELVWALHEARLSRQLAESKRPFYYLRLPWATHGCDANFSGPSGQLSTYAIERFLAAVMPPKSEGRRIHSNVDSLDKLAMSFK